MWMYDLLRDIIYNLYLSYFQYNLIFIKATNLTQLINITTYYQISQCHIIVKNLGYIINYFLAKSMIVDFYLIKMSIRLTII